MPLLNWPTRTSICSAIPTHAKTSSALWVGGSQQPKLLSLLDLERRAGHRRPLGAGVGVGEIVDLEHGWLGRG